MKPQNQRLALIIVAAVVVGALLGIGGYSLVSGLHSEGSDSLAMGDIPPVSTDITPVSTTSSVIVSVSSSSAGTSATSSDNAFDDFVASSSQVATEPSAPVPAPVDMSDWQTYTNYELGFSFQYPPDLTVDTSNPSAVTLTFPPNYFLGATADTDTFSVIVSSACPAEQSYSDSSGVIPSQTVNLNGITFTEYTQQSTGAASHSDALIYEGSNNDVCYDIAYNSNGQIQPSSSATAYANDVANIQTIVNSMLSTFAFVTTPAGENEASYSAQQAAQGTQPSPVTETVTTGSSTSIGTGIINLSTVSPNPVSVGQTLVLTGTGFSGSNTIVWISNGSVQGVLWGGPSSSDTSISATVPPQACTQNIVAGATCPSYLILNPGVYTVDVSDQNGTTDQSYIRIQ